ncbi:MAG TPA: substrate-binding domain-containing protein, partial [Levilinea sp.]|nr:substrate-binding domain-containing protein [Levilinea sp.]
MSIKKLLIFIGLVLGALSLTSCGNPGTNAAPAEHLGQPAVDAPLTIALVMSNRTNPLYAEVESGARQAENDLGVRLVVRTAAQETSVDQQIQIVEDLIREQVHAIVVAPVDSFELIPVLKKAQDAGIAIITIENSLDAELSEKVGLSGVAYIGANNEQAAFDAARIISSQLSQPTKVLILEGKRTTNTSESRKNGALRAFRENANIIA